MTVAVQIIDNPLLFSISCIFHPLSILHASFTGFLRDTPVPQRSARSGPHSKENYQELRMEGLAVPGQELQLLWDGG